MYKLLSLLFCLIITTVNAKPAETPPGFAVASANTYATNAGMAVMAIGGNAFDAAVAISAVLAVVEPYHSGLGGGGFWLLHLANGKDIFVDGREVAPLKASANMFLDENGEPVPELSLNGGLAVAIPGEVKALVHIAENYGRLPLKTSLKPAIKLAREGYKVDHHFYDFLTRPKMQEVLKKYKSSQQIFLPNHKPPKVGQLLKQPDLAKTLEIIAEKGDSGFYEGEIAEKLVNSVNKAGGIWTLDDLKNYRIKLRKPLTAKYHNLNLITAPLPSGGGIALITMLNILAPYDLPNMKQLAYVHYVVESMRLAYWQRAQFLGDSDFVSVPVAKLLSKANAEYLRNFIKPNVALSSAELAKKAPKDESKNNTTQFAVLDAMGNYVSATLTINYIFGSGVVAALPLS